MSDQAVYRSSAPEVTRAWDDALRALDDYRVATTDALEAARVGGYPVYRHAGHWSFGRVSGIQVADGADVPEGWRIVRDTDRAMPDKRTKAGRAIWQALEDIELPGNPLSRLPGMPADLLTGLRLISPSVRLIGDALYAVWAADPAGNTGDLRRSGQPCEVDLNLWERVKLSEYYAVIEALEAEAVTSNG
jgi:hypothetical protein